MRIGDTITITKATNPTIVGKRGIVVDETANTITINTHGKHITIIKNQIIEESP